MNIINFIKKQYTPTCLEEYKLCLESFDWERYFSDAYYPSLDTIAIVLYNLAKDGDIEWQKAYNEIHSRYYINKDYKPPFLLK